MNVCINDKVFPCAIMMRGADPSWGGRASALITLELSVETVCELFVTGAAWQLITDRGEQQDMSDYSLAGAVTDNRDGTVTVKMGKYTADELTRMAYGEVPATATRAQEIRPIMLRMAAGVTDEEASVIPAMYPVWDQLVAEGATVTVGDRITHGGKLYRVVQSHTVQRDWVPGQGTAALYCEIGGGTV